MKKNITLIIFGVVIAALFVLLQMLFIVRQGEVAVVTMLGKPVKAVTDAGLYSRWPWPIQRVYSFDNRTRTLEGSFEETQTADGKNVLVSVYAGWRIADPVQFLERVGTAERAEQNLDGLIRTYKNASVGQLKFGQLVNTEAAQLKYDDLEKQLLAAVQGPAKERYGIELNFVGVRRVGLPESVTASVFDRMRAERQELADRYKSEGQGEAIKIRAQADSERDQMLAKADAEARKLRAEGDAAAAQYYQTFAKNPELATFLRKLEVMQETLKEKSTVVLSADTEPFDLLKGKAKGEEKK
jgi:modulator of FtsH protease HflC